jgi:hypothetical protein
MTMNLRAMRMESVHKKRDLGALLLPRCCRVIMVVPKLPGNTTPFKGESKMEIVALVIGLIFGGLIFAAHKFDKANKDIDRILSASRFGKWE